jgi:hypothetical protein
MKTLEEEASDWCMKKDEEIGEYWSNDFEELPIQIADFTRNSKWVQAEKIKAQIDILWSVCYDYSSSIIMPKIKDLEQQLKEIEDESKID